jgi:hypothetical protein
MLPSTMYALCRKSTKVASVLVPLLVLSLAAALLSVQGPVNELGPDRGGGGHLVQLRRWSPRRHRPVHIFRKLTDTSYTSSNWAGYAVTGANGSVTDVKASWKVPEIARGGCYGATVNDGPYASFWAGMDGWTSTSNTVEQIGTDSDCVNEEETEATGPNYFAWFEFYPQNSYTIGNYTDAGVCESDCVKPGDIISAEVTYIGGGGGPRHGAAAVFKMTITDVTQQWTFSTHSAVSGAEQSSAEWITEATYGCGPMEADYCNLTNFGTADYGKKYAPVPSGNTILLTGSATVSGVTQAVGDFTSSLQESIMVNSGGDTIMAEPNPSCPPEGSLQGVSSTGSTTCTSASDVKDVGDDGTSFPVVWYNAGP